MAPLRNTKHELFAQYRSEGRTQDEAYELAGYSPDRGHASRLASDGNIVTRVRELMDRRAKMADVTVETISRELDEAAGDAKVDGGHAARVAAIMGKAKLHGLIVDKQKVEQGRLDGMDDAAIADDIESRLARIAKSRVEGPGEPDRPTGEAPEREPDPALSPVPEAVGLSREGQDT